MAEAPARPQMRRRDRCERRRSCRGALAFGALVAAGIPKDVVQVVPSRYRNPQALPPGGVLVVGASASGVQLADEIHASGRRVTLAVGRHTRLPRVYRGRDILWWLDAMGILDESTGEVFDLAVSRNQPSLQLVGRRDRATLDLPVLEARGVRLVGRSSLQRRDHGLADRVASAALWEEGRAVPDAVGRLLVFEQTQGVVGQVAGPDPGDERRRQIAGVG